MEVIITRNHVPGECLEVVEVDGTEATEAIMSFFFGDRSEHFMHTVSVRPMDDADPCSYLSVWKYVPTGGVNLNVNTYERIWGPSELAMCLPRNSILVTLPEYPPEGMEK